MPVKKNRGVNHVLNTFIESPDVNIDDIDISQKDENKRNEADTSINEADADITLHTVQTPHDTYREIHPNHFAQIQAINAPQPASSTQTKQKAITPNYQTDETAPVQQCLTIEPELNIFQNTASVGDIQDKSQYGTDLQEHLQKLSTGQFERATPSFKLGTKRKYQEVTRRSDVTTAKKRDE